MDDDVSRLPVRRRRDMAEDLDWMLKLEEDQPHIAVNAALSDDEARVAEQEAREAHRRDQRRRRGLLALPLVGLDKAKHAAQQRPKTTAAVASAVAIAGVLVAAAALLPHAHGPGSRTLAQPPQARPSAPAKPRARRPRSSHPPAVPPAVPRTPPSARPGHPGVPVANPPRGSHPGQHKPPPPTSGHPPESPPTAASLPCRIYVTALGVHVRVTIGDEVRRLLGALCPRSP